MQNSIRDGDRTIVKLRAEIARLQIALDVFAGEDNWKELSINGSHEAWLWDHDGTSGRPFLFARNALECKP
jgi:hypothetical protein